MRTSGKLKRWAPLLNALTKLPPSERSHLLRYAKPELVSAISECADNLLRGAVPLSGSQIGRLKRHRSTLHNLASRQVGLARKRKLLASRQTGGFLPLLLAPLAGILGSVIGDAISSAFHKQ